MSVLLLLVPGAWRAGLAVAGRLLPATGVSAWRRKEEEDASYAADQ